jgi:DUF2975 family protein
MSIRSYRFSYKLLDFGRRSGEDAMKPFRATQTAGLLKGLLDLGFWAIVVLAPAYVVLVVVGYLRSGDPDMALGVDVWFNPTPVAWALEGDGSRAARIVHGVGAVRFQQLPWPDLAVLLAASMLRLLLWLPVLQQLRRLLGALSVGRPFVRENADRLRKLGWTLVLVELALAALRVAEGLYVAWRFRGPGLELWPRLDLPVTALFVGAALLVVAEAFRRGAQLEEDQALTV